MKGQGTQYPLSSYCKHLSLHYNKGASVSTLLTSPFPKPGIMPDTKKCQDLSLEFSAPEVASWETLDDLKCQVIYFIILINSNLHKYS